MTSERDLDLEGLLTGVEGSARVAREQLLRELLQDGCTVDDLRTAVEQDRLALLPSERLLQRDDRFVERYTIEEISEIACVDPGVLRFANSALGLPMGSAGERCHTKADLELARLLKVGLDAGVPVEAIAELNRVIARGVVAMAAASRATAVEVALAQGTTEREAALFWARAAEYLVPNTTRVIELAFEAHLRCQVREIYIGATDIVAGRTPGAQEISIAFADLVGFTRLGQTVAAEDLGKVARRLEEATAGALEPGVSIVKTIGDAVMLTSPQPAPLLETLLTLIDAARAIPNDFPHVRGGVATGAALERAGDWFGDAVNLASRITGVAEPDWVVAADSVRLATPEGYHWKHLGEPPLKGIDETPPLYRVTRA